MAQTRPAGELPLPEITCHEGNNGAATHLLSESLRWLPEPYEQSPAQTPTYLTPY